MMRALYVHEWLVIVNLCVFLLIIFSDCAYSLNIMPASGGIGNQYTYVPTALKENQNTENIITVITYKEST